MNEEHNIHKVINCMFPFFKSKFLCKRGLHNYEYHLKKIMLKPEIFVDDNVRVIYHRVEYITYMKCRCCGKEILIDDSNSVKLIEGDCTQEENPTPDNPIEIKTLELSFKNKIKSIENEE